MLDVLYWYIYVLSLMRQYVVESVVADFILVILESLWDLALHFAAKIVAHIALAFSF